MKRFLNRRRLALLLAGLLLAPACVNVDETVFLNLDGSGRIEVAYHLKREFYQMIPPAQAGMFPTTKEDVYRKFENLPGVRVEGVKLEAQGEMISLRYVLHFQDLAVFNSEAYKFNFEKDGRFKNFQLWIRGGGGANRLTNENLKKKIVSEALSQAMSLYNIRVTVHFPAPVVETNAKEVQDRTVTWVVPIWDLQKEEFFELSARIKVGKSLWERIKGVFSD